LTTGALIVAAGMSTRMKQTKQIMKVGDRTMIERIVSSFYEAGVHDVAIVLGHMADEIQEVLKKYPVTFLYNKDYATSQMFDSVKIGLEYWKERCDRVLFCPVDVAAFSVETVQKLLFCEGDWICPVFHGKKGHPILISTSVMSQILAYSGEGGLKGAFYTLGISPIMVEVIDPGAFMDSDKPEDYEKMKLYLSGKFGR